LCEVRHSLGDGLSVALNARATSRSHLFGVLSLRSNLRPLCVSKLSPAPSSRKKGGVYEWGHDWQRDLVSAIYKCQRCESDKEFDAMKQWIFDYIDSHPDLHAVLQRRLREFFTRKFHEMRHWIRMFRLVVRHLNIISSSRIEGEFGGVNFLRLHSNITLRHAL
jgi:hypothetical protein